MHSEIDPNQGLKGHLVLLTNPAWGMFSKPQITHRYSITCTLITGCLRQLCGVACRAVQERPDVVVTFMTLGGFDERITAECNRYSRSNDDDEAKEGMRRRLR